MLRGKSAVVTGSTSGIGLGIARALAAQHAHIMLNGFGESTAIDALITDLRAQYGVEVDYSSADLSRPEQVIGSYVRRFGRRCNEPMGRSDIDDSPPASAPHTR
jgi:3-hydroxybutyrate dehydrogenase